MKKFPLRKIVMCLAFLSSFYLHSQSPMVGFQIGYGHSLQSSDRLELISPFGDFFQDYYRADFSCALPLDTSFTLITGLGYHMRENVYAMFHYLHLPVSPELQFGRKIEGIIGAGIDFNFLVGYNKESDFVYSGFAESKNRFQIGWQFHGGIGLNIFTKTKIRLLYQNYFDLTKAFELNQASPGGAPYTIDRQWYDGMILLSALWKINDTPLTN